MRPMENKKSFSKKKTGYTSIMKIGRKTNENINENEICSKIPGEK